MARNISKAIEEWQQHKCKFYISDVTQIIELSEDVYDMIHNALKAGYAIGYRTAVRRENERRSQRYH